MSFRRILPLLFTVAGISVTNIIAASSPATTEVVRYVTDGDTFRLESGERIRIANIDAPETHADQAHCQAEMALGETATAKARAILDQRGVSIVRVGRSYNRTVARVSLGDRDVGTMFIELGVAKAWPRGRPKPDWCVGSRTWRNR